MKLFVFELKRFIKNPKNIVCLILLSLIFIGLFIFNQTTVNQKFSEMDLANARENFQQAKQAVESLEQSVKLTPNDEEIDKKLKKAQADLKLFSEKLSALEKKDFKKFAEINHQLTLSSIKLVTKKDSEEYRELDSQLRYYDAIKAVNGSFSSAINESSDSAFIVGQSMMAWLSSTTIFVLLAVLVSDSISSEIESSQIRFYQLLGGRKLKHLLYRLGVPILITFGWTLLTFICLYVACGILNGFGTWQYPYLLSDRSILPIWIITLHTVLLYLTALVFIASLGQFLSLLFKKTLVVIGLITIFLTGFATVSREDWFQPFKVFFPFEYMGYGQLINDVTILPKNAFWIGICYLLGLSLVFIAFSNYLYQHYYYRKVGKI